jgi:hypothetical protein
MIRIQLASNFQVVELTYNSWAEANLSEIEEATELVNALGQKVTNEIKTRNTPAKPKEAPNKPSQKQIDYAVSLGLSPAKAKKMTKEEIWEFINDNQ